jgi:hypothetical protein
VNFGFQAEADIVQWRIQLKRRAKIRPTIRRSLATSAARSE